MPHSQLRKLPWSSLSGIVLFEIAGWRVCFALCQLLKPFRQPNRHPSKANYMYNTPGHDEDYDGKVCSYAAMLDLSTD